MGVALLHEMLLYRISTTCISSYQYVLLVLSHRHCMSLRVHVLPSTSMYSRAPLQVPA
jgi:hypothetical protein